MNEKAGQAALNFMQIFCGQTDCEVLEVRPDPNVNDCYAVRLRVEDDDRLVFLINFQYGEGPEAIMSETRLEEGQNSLDDIPVGPLRFI